MTRLSKLLSIRATRTLAWIPIAAPALLRNYPLEQLPRLLVDEREPQELRALAETPEGLLAAAGVIGCGAWVGVRDLPLQGPVDQDGELPGGSGDRLGLADPRGQAAVEGAKGCLCPADAHGGESQGQRRAVCGGLGLRAE